MTRLFRPKWYIQKRHHLQHLQHHFQFEDRDGFEYFGWKTITFGCWSRQQGKRPKKAEPLAPKEQKKRERQLSNLEDILAALPTICSWKGYQFHSDTADDPNPIRCKLRSASIHDSQGALPLAVMTQQLYRLRPTTPPTPRYLLAGSMNEARSLDCPAYKAR